MTASAGVFSFLGKLFSSAKADSAPIQQNSQNMALLEATLSPDQHTSSSSISIEGGTSLVATPENGPGATHTADTDRISLYVVREGDTLPTIAKMFDVSVNTIVWGNNLVGRKISVGQTLVILPISGVQYTVKKGDTVKSIAAKFKGDADEIMQYNNLSSNTSLTAGDTVIIPDGEVTTPVSLTNTGAKSTKSKSTTNPNGYPVYVGYYMRPIVGGVKTQGLHGHNGIDLASSYGANILASAAGTVLVSRNSGWNGGYGSYIVIQHDNGTQTLYGHLSGTAVSVGDTVTQGQVIGYMGRSGEATGVHLHFEIRGAANPF